MGAVSLVKQMNQTLGQVCNYPSLGGWRSLGLYERLEPINKWSVNSILYTAETAGDSAWRPLSTHHKMMRTCGKDSATLSWRWSCKVHLCKWLEQKPFYYTVHTDYTVKWRWWLNYSWNSGWIRSNFKPSYFFSPTNWDVGPPGLSKHNNTKVVNYVLSSRVHREDLKCAKENDSCL